MEDLTKLSTVYSLRIVMRTVVIIPAYNETSRIQAVIRDVLAYVPRVVVVDDCSCDDTGDRAREAGAIVLKHLINRGQGAALQTATDYALHQLGAEVIVHFDADGQMQASDINRLVAPIVRGEADIVLGSRFLGTRAENMPLFRRIMLRAGVLFIAIVSGLKITDSQNGFRALSRTAALELRITLDRIAHASEILDLIKVRSLRYQEQPVTIRYSSETLQKSPSNWKALDIVKDLLKKKLVH